jgi:hypothetical protein
MLACLGIIKIIENIQHVIIHVLGTKLKGRFGARRQAIFIVNLSDGLNRQFHICGRNENAIASASYLTTSDIQP